MSINNSRLINRTSGKIEWYTPLYLIEAAKHVLGAIDLDPASSRTANTVVKAYRYYDIRRDGLGRSWWNTLDVSPSPSRVWLNPPYGRGISLWIDKLIDEYTKGHVSAALVLTFGSTETGWYQKLIQFPQCLLKRRVQHWLPDGSKCTGSPRGSVVTYIGPNWNRFVQVFEIDLQLGPVTGLLQSMSSSERRLDL